MKNLIFLSGAILTLILLPSCKDVAVKSIVDAERATVRNDSIDMDSISVPVLTHEQQEVARQVAILRDYIEIEGNHYVLKISEEDALKAGVSREVYREVVQDLKTGNESIDEIKDENIEWELLPIDDIKGKR
ncbi:hypothetical protein [uncultured Duncaniella sp.]|uniref:hypothetical protein n=1 Tax=uncultured Duncaniella sp. TaxID=2768039 RepID=UPI00262676B1|nr:hypothetical protein [uncultured Duncaniella sp.]